MKLARAALAASSLAIAAGCGSAQNTAGRPGASGAATTASAAPIAPLDLRSVAGRPPILLVPRDGDPSAALAASVVVDAGPVAATALAALTEARLAALGVTGVDASADRDGYRVRVLAKSGDEVATAVAALRAAMLAPLGEEPLARKLVVARVAALHARTFDSEVTAAIARCTEELGVSAGESTADPIAKLEGWRVAAHGTSTVAFAIVGPEALGDSAIDAVAKGAEWPAVQRGAAPPSPASAGIVVDPTRRKGTARVSIAVRLAERGTALALALDLGAPGSLTAARLLALPVPFRMRRVATTVAGAGACVLVEADADATSSALETSAVAAAALVAREIAAAPRADDAVEASRHVRAVTDPREAAAAAARWALSRPGAGLPITHVALAIAPSSSARASEGDANASSRFAEAVTKALAAPTQTVEVRARVERGQGEAWVLVGTPCAVVEDASAAGLTALAMVRAARDGDGREGVALEPWVAPDGAGLVAHAAPRAGETGGATIARTTAVAARALYGAAPPESAFVEARASLLAQLEAGGERARDPLVAALAPASAATLAPWGLFDAVARAGAVAVDLRRDALVAGAARVAVISPEVGADASAVAPILARWLPARERVGACAPLGGASLASGLVHLPSGSSRARGWVAVLFDATGAGASAATITALSLGGEGGTLERALETTSVRGSAYLLGAGPRAALVVELRGEPDRLELAVAQVRALFVRLAQGAASPADLERATSRFSAGDVAAHLDPRRRLVDLFRGVAAPALPALPAWRSWLAGALRDDRVTVVLPPAK